MFDSCTTSHTVNVLWSLTEGERRGEERGEVTMVRITRRSEVAKR
jgi:hypothetical protein